jgi:hypothetical protein
MTADEIRAAFAPFIALLRAGGFERPEQGWPAELVAAHVALNNDAFAEAAAAIRRGEQPSYDNTEIVDRETLQAYADRVGGLDALADAVEASANRLAEAHAALDDERAARHVHVRIRHEGQLVNDEPGPIGWWTTGAASFHLRMHTEQLESLLPRSS